MATAYPIVDRVNETDVEGSVIFTDSADLTTKKQRAILRALRRFPKSIVTPDKPGPAEGAHAAGDGEPDVDDGLDLTGLPADLTENDVDAIWAYNDTLILLLTESWTLDRQLPSTADDLENLPQRLYQSLQQAVADMQADNPDLAGDAEFTVDAVEDRDSPTGA